VSYIATCDAIKKPLKQNILDYSIRLDVASIINNLEDDEYGEQIRKWARCRLGCLSVTS
jgi:phage anti-repressor protein